MTAGRARLVASAPAGESQEQGAPASGGLWSGAEGAAIERGEDDVNRNVLGDREIWSPVYLRSNSPTLSFRGFATNKPLGISDAARMSGKDNP